jgi:hypothetical protein
MLGEGREMKQDLRPYALEGLFMTCDHAASCAYLARTEGPIWRCEEFDDSGRAAPGPVMRAEPRPSRPTVEPVSAEPAPLLGLCRNCEHRSYCRLPGAREGVLFCEEYL